MKKFTNKILIITTCIIISYSIICSFIFIDKINNQVINGIISERDTLNMDSSYIQFKDGEIEINKITDGFLSNDSDFEEDK